MPDPLRSAGLSGIRSIGSSLTMTGDHERLKLLLIQGHFAHYRADLLTALAQEPHIDLVLADDHQPRRTYSMEFIPTIPQEETHPLKRRQLDLVRRGSWSWQRHIRRAIVDERPDVVVLAGDYRWLSNWFLLLRHKVPGHTLPKILVWTHGWTRHDKWTRSKVKRAFFGLSDGLLVYSKRGRDIGVAQGFDKPIYVMNNSVQSRRTFSTHESGTHGHRLTLVCVTRLTKDRELEDLLHAMSLLTDAGTDVQLKLVGDGLARPSLEALAKSLQVDVEFFGPVYGRQSLDDIYSASQICVVPGRAGLAVIQAMGRGLPVIAHDDLDSQMPEVEAIEPGRTGDFYTRGSARSLASAIARVSTAQKAGAMARAQIVAATISAYSAEEQARRIIDACWITARGFTCGCSAADLERAHNSESGIT